MPNNPDKTIRILLITVFITYVLLVIYGLTFHEPWRDEAQAWLLTRDATIGEIFRSLPSEGHPPLWYLILLPFAKTGMPYISQNIITACIMIAATYILLFKTSIYTPIKFILPFSYFFLYQYTLLARSYCLVAFFISAIISLYPQRFEKKKLFALCVIGLFNTHILAFSFCFVVTSLYLFDAIQYKKISNQLIVLIVLMYASGLYLIPYLGSNTTSPFFKTIIHYGPLRSMANAINGALLILKNDIASVLVFSCLVLLLTARIKPLMLLIGGLAAALYIPAFVYSSTTRHFGVILLIIIAAYAIAPVYSKNVKDNFLKYGNIIIAIVLTIQISTAFSNYTDDKERLYSDAKNAAEFLETNGLDKSILVGQQAWAAGSLLPYLSSDIRFYYTECQCYGSYFKYDSCFMKENWAKATDLAINGGYKLFQDKLDQIVFVLNHDVHPQTARYLDLIYKTDEQPISGEGYYIYKFKKGVR
jgi:hypothetical protein